jgi:predicted anti-sigma-YlaC factor YlaD
VALASLAVNNQDRAEFERLLTTALAIDPEKDPATRLVTLVTQRRARLMLERVDEKFLK